MAEGGEDIPLTEHGEKVDEDEEEEVNKNPFETGGEEYAPGEEHEMRKNNLKQRKRESGVR